MLESRAEIPRISGNRQVSAKALVTSCRGRQRTVTTVPRPSQRQRQGTALKAELLGIVEVSGWQGCSRHDGGVLDARAEVDGIALGKGHTKTDAAARGDQLVITLVLVGAEGFVIRAQGARYAITREIGVCGAEIEHPVYLAGVELHAQRITRAKGVVLLQAELQSKPITAGKASPKAQAAGGLFHQIQIQVDLVWRARNLRGFDRHIAEIAQPVDPVPREFYFVAVVPGCFELPELPAHHDIARAVVTR